MRVAISFCLPDSFSGRAANQSPAWRIDMSETWAMWWPAILTDSASGFSRAPSQALHGVWLMYFSISSRDQALSVSRQRRSRLFTTPSNGFFVSKERRPSS